MRGCSELGAQLRAGPLTDVEMVIGRHRRAHGTRDRVMVLECRGRYDAEHNIVGSNEFYNRKVPTLSPSKYLHQCQVPTCVSQRRSVDVNEPSHSCERPLRSPQ